MKMVKSLLLGTAAGFVAIAGAQAADLPVKAKPVQYVKICSLYGAGFYYIPGTDTCLKVGGWVRQYLGWNSNGNLTNGYLASGNVNTRASNNGWTWKARGYITADARTQTEYGTLRGYLDVGFSSQGTAGANGAAGANFNSNRAFIQLAGFTFGVTQSFYDLYPTPALSYFGGMINPSSDTGDGGITTSAYTAQFGGGFSASISAEAPRTTTTVGPGSVFSTTTGPSQQHASTVYPDVVANLRLDQTWGSAQIMGAIHDASGLYYSAATGAQDSGHPSNAMGWVVGAGVLIKSPWGPGDYFSAQVNYTQGAPGYMIAAANSQINVPGAGGWYSNYNGGGGGSYGFGVVADGVYGVGGSVELTTTWGVNAAYEHHWNEKWQTSVYGAYTQSSFDAVANATLCGLESAGGFAGAAMTVANGCDNNWSYFAVGSRTQFNVDSQTYIGLDIIYTDLRSASNGVNVTIAGSGAQPSALRTLSDQSAWTGEFRFHRNFYP